MNINKRLLLFVILVLAVCQFMAYLPGSFVALSTVFNRSGIAGGVSAPAIPFWPSRPIFYLIAATLFMSDFVGAGVFVFFTNRQQLLTLKQGLVTGALVGVVARLLSVTGFIVIDLWALFGGFAEIASLFRPGDGEEAIVPAMIGLALLGGFLRAGLSGLLKGGLIGAFVAHRYGKS